MAKDRERRDAFEMYTEQFKQANEIADILKVTQKTVGEWIKKGGWKAIRNTNINSSKNQASNLKEAINELTEQQLDLFKDINIAKGEGDKERVAELRKQSSAISQEIAVQTKALERVSDSKMSLATYLDVMNDIFQALEQYDKVVYKTTLDFQDAHLQTISLKLG